MGARCASHPETASVLTCVRCGAFACAACARNEWCLACWDAGHGTTFLPWEHGPAYFATLLSMWRAPRETFARMGPGRWQRSFTFAVLTVALLYALSSVTQVAAGGEVAQIVGGLVCGVPLVSAGIALQWGLSFALTLRVGAAIAGLREEFSFGDAFRIATYSLGYASGYGPVFLMSGLSPPLGGVLLLVAMPVVTGMQISAMQAHLSGRYRLSPLAALLVALTPLICVGGLIALIVGLAIYRRYGTI